MQTTPLMRVLDLSKQFDAIHACRGISFELYKGEVLGIVGESGSGKTTLLRCLSGELAPSAGTVSYDVRMRGLTDIAALSEPERRLLRQTDWGIVHQNPRDGLRMNTSAGGNVGERLMAVGARHYGQIRAAATDWLERVELDTGRIDDAPATFSGGMQQRLHATGEGRGCVVDPRRIEFDPLEPICRRRADLPIMPRANGH